MCPDQRLAGLIAAEAGGCPPADLLFFWGTARNVMAASGPAA